MYMKPCSPIDSGYLKLCCQAILEILLVILVGTSPVHAYRSVLGCSLEGTPICQRDKLQN